MPPVTTFDHLLDFITGRMRMSHIYQPVMLITLLESTTAVAVKRVVAWQIERKMSEADLTKSEMARLMSTSRSSLDRVRVSNVGGQGAQPIQRCGT